MGSPQMGEHGSQDKLRDKAHPATQPAECRLCEHQAPLKTLCWRHSPVIQKNVTETDSEWHRREAAETLRPEA